MPSVSGLELSLSTWGSYFNIFLFLFVLVIMERSSETPYFAQKTAKDMISIWLQPPFIFLFVVN